MTEVGAAFGALLLFWQVSTALIGVWALVVFCRAFWRGGSRPPPAHHHPPAPGYRPRWDLRRRQSEARARAEWQESFDRRVKDHAVQE